MAKRVSLPNSASSSPELSERPSNPTLSKILLIEDDVNDIALIEQAFRRAHPAAKLQVLNNGEEAIAYLLGDGIYGNRRRYPMPDLIILDLKIPRKSGLEVLSWIWEQPHLKPIRVVVLTGSEQSADIQRVRDLDAYYQLKPSNFKKLLAFIQTICARWSSPASLTRRKNRSLIGAPLVPERG